MWSKLDAAVIETRLDGARQYISAALEPYHEAMYEFVEFIETNSPATQWKTVEKIIDKSTKLIDAMDFDPPTTDETATFLADAWSEIREYSKEIDTMEIKAQFLTLIQKLRPEYFNATLAEN